MKTVKNIICFILGSIPTIGIVLLFCLSPR